MATLAVANVVTEASQRSAELDLLLLPLFASSYDVDAAEFEVDVSDGVGCFREALVELVSRVSKTNNWSERDEVLNFVLHASNIASQSTKHLRGALIETHIDY